MDLIGFGFDFSLALENHVVKDLAGLVEVFFLSTLGAPFCLISGH